MIYPEWTCLKEGDIIIYNYDKYFSRNSTFLLKKWEKSNKWDSRSIEQLSGVKKDSGSLNYIFHYLLTIGDISILETEPLKVCL